MIPGLIAKKVGMSRIFLDTGEVAAVTYLEVGKNVVVRVKTKERDGYDAIVVGAEPRAWKTRKGRELTRFRLQKEWRVDSLEGYEPGKALTIEGLTKENFVTVSGVSKGKGFQGVMKRHHFGGGPETHGSHFKREPGSIGMREYPGRVLKGHHMAGRMGGERITLRKKPLMACDPEKGVLAIRGPVPGPAGTLVYLTVESPSQVVS